MDAIAEQKPTVTETEAHDALRRTTGLFLAAVDGKPMSSKRIAEALRDLRQAHDEAAFAVEASRRPAFSPAEQDALRRMDAKRAGFRPLRAPEVA